MILKSALPAWVTRETPPPGGSYPALSGVSFLCIIVMVSSFHMAVAFQMSTVMSRKRFSAVSSLSRVSFVHRGGGGGLSGKTAFLSAMGRTASAFAVI